MRLHKTQVRQQASIFIECWSGGKLFVLKNRYDSRSVPYEIHPNEAMKLMGKYDKVVITNWDVRNKQDDDDDDWGNE
ncbi:hypothetical protein BSK59_16155 [Paenibacillus odorifer]|uniref:hypothetical protein n=1 Tax=Paenibacillus odorifer TaxID=189426 RepID=UPI00096BF734|nr:hypothetical protein [Paenibacillus odorifer]OME54112.1 hypothetical protein BSK59_16155 [Paenibacillus odorifer]